MEQKEEKVVHSLSNTSKSSSFSMVTGLIILVVFGILGMVGGWVLTKNNATAKNTSVAAGGVKTNSSAGVKDEKQFPNKAEGTLREGGIDGEGSFHLERPGGDSQNVYLTSSIVDLSTFVGKKIRVWGQTFQGQKAGWLMDVGYVEIL